MNQEQKDPQENFGMPSGSFDPMKSIEMQGDMYRGMVSDHAKPLWVRLFSMAFGLGIFLTLGLFYVAATWPAFQEGDFVGSVFGGILGFLYVAAGSRILYKNIRNIFKKNTHSPQ